MQKAVSHLGMSISAHHGDPSAFLFYLLNIPLLSRGSNWSNGSEEVSSRYWEQIGCGLDVMSISTTLSVPGWTLRNTRLYKIHAVRMSSGKPKRWSVFASYYPHILVLYTQTYDWSWQITVKSRSEEREHKQRGITHHIPRELQIDSSNPAIRPSKEYVN